MASSLGPYLGPHPPMTELAGPAGRTIMAGRGYAGLAAIGQLKRLIRFEQKKNGAAQRTPGLSSGINLALWLWWVVPKFSAPARRFEASLAKFSQLFMALSSRSKVQVTQAHAFPRALTKQRNYNTHKQYARASAPYL